MNSLKWEILEYEQAKELIDKYFLFYRGNTMSELYRISSYGTMKKARNMTTDDWKLANDNRGKEKFLLISEIGLSKTLVFLESIGRREE